MTITKIKAQQYCRDAYTTYGQYVVGNRAVADFRDGLKPVQRRILWAMNEEGLRPGKQYSKCAGVVGDVLKKYHPHGDCLSGDTEVFDLSGKFWKIKDLRGPIHVLAYDTSTQKTVPALARAWRVGQRASRIFRVELSDGSVLRVTGNHPFYSHDGQWLPAEKLTIGTRLFGGRISNITNRYFSVRDHYSKTEPLHITVYGKSPAAGMTIHHVDHDSHNNTPQNLVCITRAEHAVEHDDAVNAASPAFMLCVRSIDIENLSQPEDMYDFTVDGYQNMFVPTNRTDDSCSLVLLHNSSVYDAMVRLVQPWNARYPLVDGQGNFGSVAGDPAAAYRYTECRLTKQAMMLLGSPEITETQSNFDGTRVEPVVLPATLPFLLLNGSSGIAVGIASEIPPHRATEILDALLVCLDRGSKTTLDDLLQHVKGPDYGTGVLLSGPDQLRALYEDGEGTLSYRCHYRIERTEGQTEQSLVVTDYAPRFNVQKFNETCARYVEAGNLLSVSDESSAENGVRLVIEFVNARFVQDHVIPALETSVSYRFYVNETTTEGPTTRKMGLLDLLTRWLAFRREIETRIITAEIKRLEGQLLREQTRLLAAQQVRKIVDMLARGSETPEQDLMDLLSITQEQAGIILDIPLRTLNKLNVASLKQQVEDTNEKLLAERNKLKRVDRILAASFARYKEDFLPDERGTSLGGKRPKLVVGEDVANTWLIANHEGSVTRLEGSPVDRRGGLSYEMAVHVGAQFWAVLATGQMLRVDTASLAVGKPRAFGKLAGIVPCTAARIVVLDQDGNGLVLDGSALAKDKYQCMKTGVPVIKAIGLSAQQGFFAFNDEVSHGHGPDTETTRINSTGWKLIPKRKRGATFLQVTEVARYGETIEVKGPDVLFSPRVLVEWVEGGKEILERAAYLKACKVQKPAKTLPIA